ncbi:hypothetical protein [Streptomyces werraensis]|uniref:hypothetical protein n=1 Tax=Streptomyces werraensis TaxID=68284 RepID=UPI001CE2BE4B
MSPPSDSDGPRRRAPGRGRGSKALARSKEPDGDVTKVTFSTPLQPVADAMAGLFDAIASSLTWTE